MTTTITTAPVLDDVLVAGLDIVFCGTAAGHTSASTGRYYAGPGNQFWAVLHATGLTPRQLRPSEFRDLPRYGIGLTDVCKHTSGNDRDLERSDFDIDAFWQRISDHEPGIVAFNGKKAAKIALRLPAVSYGPQRATHADVQGFVLPSTSGAARGHWDLSRWRELARQAQGRRQAKGR
jgi:TDG/mug DNA glycosylase family protein